jgi:glycosyltransferase involved in cell wall biosynthesis
LQAKNLFIECHTPYVENRQYLKNLPENICGLLVPSEAFKTLLLGEFDPLPPIFVVPNPVTDEFFNQPRGTENGIFSRRPLAYLARLDDLKNIDEALRIFETLAGDERMMFALVGRGAEEGRLLAEVENKHLLGKTFLRDQVGFGDVPAFIRLVRDHRGIFISPSRCESFGLSAAEFISGGVPVLLSDIPPHCELVNQDPRFLYPLGDIGSAREKIFHLVEEWDKANQSMLDFREKFRGIHFIKAWTQFSAAAH